ncbi:MMPL family transporter [Williamsia herbipolensis]|uniref:MMPL family transporter n=1 Tax=Williamsia herbipolensis TaxID=1603258 RepID=A0AAU4JZ50_9NOCA|nr:MMPL family transporter [Williamsia herbipolensis]
MASFIRRIGAYAHRHRYAVVGVWLVVLVASVACGILLSGKMTSSFEIKGQESSAALHRIDSEFGRGGTNASAKVVFEATNAGTVTAANTITRIDAIVNDLRALPGVLSASDPFASTSPTVSPDRVAAYSSLMYKAASGDVTDDQRAALLSAVKSSGSADLTVEVTGSAVKTPVEVLGPTEVIGLVVALLILALTYGSLTAAGMNLLTALVGVGIGAASILTVSGFTQLQTTTPILAVMLGLAVGIDYALLIINRFRIELRSRTTVADAVANAVGTGGSAVVVAGTTVVIALAGLSLVGIPFLTQMGLAAAGTIILAVLIALTLVPAVLGFVGERALSKRAVAERDRVDHATDSADPASGVPSRASGRFYERWVSLVTRHPWPTLVSVVLVLIILAVPVLSLRTSLVNIADPASTQGRAEAAISSHYGPGFNSPLLVLVEGDRASDAASDVATTVKTLDDVRTVGAPTANGDGRAAIIRVIPKSAPSSQATADLVSTIRNADHSDTNVSVSVTGETAVSVDVGAKLSSTFPIYLILVVGLALILLILVFRSILVPVIGVIGFLLTIGVSFGATVAVFQWGWLSDFFGVSAVGPLKSLMPVLVVGILFGLAMDYQVFLVSSMHEAHTRGLDAKESIRSGFRTVAPVVVAAAVIMFGVFAGFIPSNEPIIKVLAFALTVGVAIDALVVRMVLIPAAMAVLGSAAWALPGWLRWIPAVNVEGSSPAQSPGLRPVGD